MKTALIILSFVFLIGCAVQEPAVPEVVPQEIEVIEETPVPEPVAQEPVSEEPAEPEPVPVEHEQVNLTVPVGGEVQCPNPERYTYVDGYCVEDACQNKAVKCMVQGNRIMRPECECWIYMGEPICSIMAGEETRINSPLCTRKGHVRQICGAYDSNKGHCVNF